MSSSPAKALRSHPYTHTRTFFNYNRWSAHDFMGELMAQGITQFQVLMIGADWVVSWVTSSAPDVLKEAAETPADGE